MGTNPTISDPIDSQLELNEFLTFSFRKNPLAEDVTFTLEQSSDLDAWATANDAISLVAETANQDGTRTLLYRSILSQDGNPLFLRMRVTLN